MAEETKQGLWSKLFRAKSSCCGDLKIEAIPEDSAVQTPKAGETEAGKTDQNPAGKPRVQRRPCCGGGDAGSSSGGGCCG